VTAQPPFQVPPGASDVVRTGPSPFVTSVEYTLPDGRRGRWRARDHRKRVGGGSGLTRWIGLMFAIGSVCFLLGPIPLYADAVGARATAITFFVGSVFFTSGAALSYLQVVRDAGGRWIAWAPHVMGFWATLIQLVGTLYFNVTTFAALLDVPADMVDRVIWRPDAIGSICFLVSSAIAFAEAGHRWFSWRPGHPDWHVTALNWWGSVFFGVSAIGAYVQPSGQLTDAQWANGGTFLGALCFLTSSLLTMGEHRSEPTTASDASAIAR
jgi:hypothetical protein